MTAFSTRLPPMTDAPPGVVVAHSPRETGLYIGSPSLCVLPGGGYVASHDLFGPASAEHRAATARVYGAGGKGERWQQLAELEGQFWSGLFVHANALFLMGTDKHYGNLVIRRSDDGGRTWRQGLVRSGRYHTGPVPVLLHNGRIWRAAERADGPAAAWSRMMSAVMFSADEQADLLQPESWRESEALPYDAALLNGRFQGWLEGNAVAAPDGAVWNMLRVHHPEERGRELAAIIRLSEDGRRAALQGFTGFPGGGKKFSIRYDAVSNRYWTIANYVPPAFRHLDQLDKLRNTQALCSSADLLQWELHRAVLHHPDHLVHGFNYADWQFDGADIVFVSRTAFNADSFHNANYLTFHRVHDFRNIKPQNEETIFTTAGG